MFLINASALVGLIVTMIIILVAGMIVLGVLMAWYLTKGNTKNNVIEGESEPVASQAKQTYQPKQPKVSQSKEPKAKQEKIEIKDNSYGANATGYSEPKNNVPYGESKNTAPYGESKNTAPYGEQKNNVPYGEGKNTSSAPYGSGYGAGYGSAFDEGDTKQKEKDEAYGSKKSNAKLNPVQIELPKNDWGTKSLFERVSGLSNEQKTLYERARSLLKSRLTNYTTDICEVYFNGEVPAGRLIVYKNQILLFISIPPNEVSKEKFHIKDTTNSNVSNGLPTLLLLKTMEQVNGIERLVDKIIVE